MELQDPGLVCYRFRGNKRNCKGPSISIKQECSMLIEVGQGKQYLDKIQVSASPGTLSVVLVAHHKNKDYLGANAVQECPLLFMVKMISCMHRCSLLSIRPPFWNRL